MFSRFFIDRPIFATVLSLVVTIAGGVAVWTLPLAQYPAMTKGLKAPSPDRMQALRKRQRNRSSHNPVPSLTKRLRSQKRSRRRSRPLPPKTMGLKAKRKSKPLP